MSHNDRRFYTLLMAAAVLFYIASPSFGVSAQQGQQANPQCPATKVTCPDSVYPTDKLMFTANVTGGDSNVTPTYNWTVSAGSIASGQGTSTIEVDASEVIPDSTVTATVDLGGFARECGYGSTAASCTSTVAKKVESRKQDEYGILKPADENARLDNFIIELQSDPLTQGHIIAYGGRASRAGDARKAAAKARDYLVKTRGLDAQRVVIVDGGYREKPLIELWIVPSGAQPPQPTPTVKPGEAKPASPAKPTKRKKG